MTRCLKFESSPKSSTICWELRQTGREGSRTLRRSEARGLKGCLTPHAIIAVLFLSIRLEIANQSKESATQTLSSSDKGGENERWD